MTDQGEVTPGTKDVGARTAADAEASRALVAAARSAALSTVARWPEGYPFGSLVACAADARGSPILLLSALAEHRQNLDVRSEAALLIAEPHTAGEDPLALARVTLLGRCSPIEPEGVAGARACFLRAHPGAGAYADFPDFAFYRLSVEAVRYVGGFGRMSWVPVIQYQAAAS